MGDLNELVERLRMGVAVERSLTGNGWHISVKATEELLAQSAAALISLIAERDGLREALMPFAEAAAHYRGDHAHNNMAARSGFSGKDDIAPFIPVSALRTARTALSLDTNKGDRV